MITFLENLLDLSLEAAPWLVLGLVIGGLMKSLIPTALLQKHLSGRGLPSIIKAALLGAPLPLCSCGVIPAALGLRRAGASKPATVSFLVSTPETGIDSVSISYALLGPFMAIVRPIAAIISAITAGLLVGRAEGDAPISKNISDAETSCCSPSKKEVVVNKVEKASCCSSEKEIVEETSCCSTEAPKTVAETSCCTKLEKEEITCCSSEPAVEESVSCCSSSNETSTKTSKETIYYKSLGMV